MPPLTLTDSEMTLLLELSAPIEPSLRADFLRTVASELEASRRVGAIGEGAIHRIARQIQRRFWEPPRFREGEPARRA
jgi:hypothetical protein